MLGKVELLALPNVGRAGQRRHERVRGQCASVPDDVGERIALLDSLRVVAGVGKPQAGGGSDDVVVGQHPRGSRADGVHVPQRIGDDGSHAVGGPRGGEELEVEGLAHLVGANVFRNRRGGGDPGFGHEHPVRAEFVEDLPPLPVDVVHAVEVPHRRGLILLRLLFSLDHRGCVLPIRKGGVLDEPVGDVDAKAVDAAPQPKPQNVAKFGLNLGIGPVEVGLGGVEEVEVPGGVAFPRRPGRVLPVAHPRPRPSAEDRAPVVGGRPEPVALAFGRARSGLEGLPEPDVAVARVVGHDVEDYAQPERMRACDEGVDVVHRAEDGVDVPVVLDVVSGVALRTSVEGAEPDGVDAEARQMVQPGDRPGDVADGPARRGERARVDLVDDGVSPP